MMMIMQESWVSLSCTPYSAASPLQLAAAAAAATTTIDSRFTASSLLVQ